MVKIHHLRQAANAKKRQKTLIPMSFVKTKNSTRRRHLFVILTCFLLVPTFSFGFWVVNFGTANTLAPGRFGFAAGLGQQVVFLGSPQTTSAFFTIPHAGFRLGLSKHLDAGLRLAPIPLPFAIVGPGFGVNLDVKCCFTKPDSKVQFAVVIGAGGAHVLIQNNTRLAYSPNAALLTSFKVNETSYLTVMARHVNLAIPTAADGAAGNFVNISGFSLGYKKSINATISVLPEIGAYWYDGQITSVKSSGPGFQCGLMIATSF